MRNENRLRLAVFAAVAIAHVLVLLFFAVTIRSEYQVIPENARVMKVTDFEEEVPLPPPPPPPKEEIPVVEEIAEIMIETDIEPEQTVVPVGSITSNVSGFSSWGDYLPMHMLSEPPKFNEREITAALVYPPIALRSSIEGRVVLELFVDRNGFVQQVRIMMEEPKDRGFGEAAMRAFAGKRGTPAQANGEAVSARYRYPVSFRVR